MAANEGITAGDLGESAGPGSTTADGEKLHKSLTGVQVPFVHWVIFVLYFLCTLGIALTVPWDDPHLTQPLAELSNPQPNSPTIIAMAKDSRVGNTPIPGLVNGCLIMSTVSAAGVSLYFAGQTLYGLAYGVSVHEGNLLSQAFKGLSAVWEATGVPAKALLITALVFLWLSGITLARTARTTTSTSTSRIGGGR
ncbi:hypothetical protein OQA88_7005 [Cercophora sp. LCS_1]